VRRRAVEIEVVVLDVFPVVALAVGEPEQPFLHDRVHAVPQGHRKAEDLPVVRDAAEPVLTPAIGARAGLVVAEVVPGVAHVAVVLAHGAPLAFREIRAPLLPRLAGIAGSFETTSFFGHGVASLLSGLAVRSEQV
jgi:hypothetical protein